jgi:hypothetical protein
MQGKLSNDYFEYQQLFCVDETPPPFKKIPLHEFADKTASIGSWHEKGDKQFHVISKAFNEMHQLLFDVSLAELKSALKGFVEIEEATVMIPIEHVFNKTSDDYIRDELIKGAQSGTKSEAERVRTLINPSFVEQVKDLGEYREIYLSDEIAPYNTIHTYEEKKVLDKKLGLISSPGNKIIGPETRPRI